jgi:serine/threonine-protein kinase
MAKTTPDTREEYLAEQRAAWVAALQGLFGSSPPERAEWTDLDGMIGVLSQLLKPEMHHVYLPTGGGMSMKSVSRGNERGTLALHPNKRTTYLLKPRKMTVHYFADAPAQSFLFIETDKLEQSGTYDHKIKGGSEELVEIGPGDYRERSVWDAGYDGHDEGGDEIPLPKSAKLVIRFFKGGFAIVGQGSVWNGTAATYDGEHDKLGQEPMRELIDKAIKRLGLTD